VSKENPVSTFWNPGFFIGAGEAIAWGVVSAGRCDAGYRALRPG